MSATPPWIPSTLALPATGREVARFVALRAAACVGADHSNVALLDADGTELRLFHGPLLDAELVDRYTDIPIDAPFPLAAAVKEGRAVLLSDLDAYREQFPTILDDTIAAGVQATASLPMYRSDGTLLGALGFAWSEPTAFDVKLEGALRAVAFLCVETVERAERYDAEHELVVELQSRLLGHIPELPGIGSAARYLPSSIVPSVGGDWYEGLMLSESQLALVVGDVVGHGIPAAADMALIRGMISALLHSGVAASEVFGEVSGVLVKRKAMLLATAALVIIDVADDTILFATAGHPPPLLRLPDGQVQVLDFANGPMIGVSTGKAHVAHSVPFPPGAQVMMCTDGLIEQRRRSFDAGLDEATALLARPDRLDPEGLIDALLADLVGSNRPEDDIAVLVAERTP